MSFFKSIIEAFNDEFHLVIRNIPILLFLIGLPLAYPPIYSLIYNKELVRDVAVVVVDHDATPGSRKLVRDFDATQEVKVVGYAANLDEARRAMDSHECFGILEIPAGFQKKIGRSEKANAVMYCDMTLLIRYKSLLTASTKVGSAFGAEITAADSGIVSTLMPGDPMPVEAVYLGDITGGYDSFLMPGVLVLIAQQCVIMAIIMAGGIRQEDPRFRFLQGPVVATLFGRALVYLVMMILPCILMLYYYPLMFRFPQCANIFELYLFILPMVVSSIMLGFCLQGFSSERESVFLLWAGLSIGCLFLSGFTWPRYAMPTAWKLVGDLIPATFGVIGYVRMNSNGADLTQVGNEYVALWIQAAAYTVVALIVQRHLARRQAKKLSQA